MTTPADEDLPYWHQRRALEQPFRHALRYGVFKAVQIVAFAVIFGIWQGWGFGTIVASALVAAIFFVLLHGTVGAVRRQREVVLQRRSGEDHDQT